MKSNCEATAIILPVPDALLSVLPALKSKVQKTDKQIV